MKVENVIICKYRKVSVNQQPAVQPSTYTLIKFLVFPFTELIYLCKTPFYELRTYSSARDERKT